MAGETVITLVGNVTRDPELRTTSNGMQVANFSVAATPRNFNRNTNQYEDGQTLFMNCTVWRELAEHCARSLTKGTRVIVQGRLGQQSYQAQDGSQHTQMVLTVDEVGPSLRYATAQVTRIQHGAPQGGFAPAAPVQSQAQAAQAQNAWGADPWGV